MSDLENHQHCTDRLIELANELNKEGHAKELVSAALMSASCIYVTYANAGNTGALEPSGVDKVIDVYRRNLEHIQKRKKEDLQAAQEAQTMAQPGPEQAQ